MLDRDIHKPSVMTSGGAVLSRTGVLVQAQEPRVAEEWVEDTRRTLQALEHKEATHNLATCRQYIREIPCAVLPLPS